MVHSPDAKDKQQDNEGEQQSCTTLEIPGHQLFDKQERQSGQQQTASETRSRRHRSNLVPISDGGFLPFVQVTKFDSWQDVRPQIFFSKCAQITLKRIDIHCQPICAIGRWAENDFVKTTDRRGFGNQRATIRRWLNWF